MEPRQVWLHEAHSFTPWLLANVDVLSDLLGMDLELSAAEHPVGDFALDLLGRDLNDDSVVIVENQLERSDHSHLGQLLTYAAGTDPRTIVWITTAFRSEHRAALDWLNEHTDTNTRFFGVEIEVVKIGDSPYAPNFKLVAQPNDWGKKVKAATEASNRSGVSALYWDFWRQFLDRVAEEHSVWTRAKASTTDSWYVLPSGRSGIAFLTAFRRESGLVVAIEFQDPNGARNVNWFNALKARSSDFEESIGDVVEWDERPQAKSSSVYVQSPFASVNDVDQWPAMLDWVIDRNIRIRSALDAVGGLGLFPTSIPDLIEPKLSS